MSTNRRNILDNTFKFHICISSIYVWMKKFCEVKKNVCRMFHELIHFEVPRAHKNRFCNDLCLLVFLFVIVVIAQTSRPIW